MKASLQSNVQAVPVRYYIVDDYPLFVEVLKEVLAIDGGFRALGQAHRGREALEAIRRDRPDLVLIDLDLPVTQDWITDAELAANPGLIKTMSVRPPSGQGRVRLVRIGEGLSQVDLQPCGGTHVARTAEIGRVSLGRIEKKGRQNRRVTVVLTD